jgi:hypothetical protein
MNRTMCATNISAVLMIGVALVVGASGTTEVQPARSVAATRIVSSGASATVLSTLVSRGERLVVLVLWRGAPGWLARGGRASTQAGGSEQHTWAQLARGEVTVDLEIDHTTGLARLRGRHISVGDNNVVLVDRVDTKAPIVRMLKIDPTVPDTPDAPFVVLKRDPALIEFLQCELTQADPILGRLLATHPCGRR